MKIRNGFDSSRYQFGLDILSRKMALKRDFECAGLTGLTSFVGACLLFGITHEDDIKVVAADIAGPYLDASIDEILTKYSSCPRCRQWRRTADGRYLPAR